MTDSLNIDPIRHEQSWYDEREKFRKINQQRIRRMLRPAMGPYAHVFFQIWKVCEHGKLVLQEDQFQVTLYRRSKRVMSDGQRHKMEDNAPKLLDLGKSEWHEAENLSRQAENAALFDSVTIPGGEDYDGPAINDISDEDELLAVSEAMVKAGESREIFHQSETPNGDTQADNERNS